MHPAQVVEEFTKLKPNNPLARFLPALRSVAGQGDVFTGLDGFEAAVQQLGEDKGGGWLVCTLAAGAVCDCKLTACRMLCSLCYCSVPCFNARPALYAPAAAAEFIQAQWMVCDDQYGKPAQDWCKTVECRYALTKAQLHDALVNVRSGEGRHGL